MRLWSLHPKYLDAKGLVALWREGLLARKVLRGLTRGYKHHPQLERFRDQKNSIAAIDRYLLEVHNESVRRGYNFDRRKIGKNYEPVRINVTRGQLTYEIRHLKRKLFIRDRKMIKTLPPDSAIKSHPLFRIVKGKVESWERV